ncbi:MAG: hypothetical protein RPU52_00405 [Candidatus Sedimenticola sp. (ex Thyasira tokunagai)]
MEDLRTEYKKLSIEELKTVLKESVLSAENEELCRMVLAEKMGTTSAKDEGINFSSAEISSVRKRPPIDINTKSSYKTTRAIAGFISFVGWISLVVGLFVAFQRITESGPEATIGLSMGIFIIYGALITIIGGQLTRANVDTTDYCREILDELRARK